ncbi:alpha/beta fold hydrolase [Nitratireductor soli]|uniref:alpha/beta fold hydrolase n=1 Tax=Nitratireductor soli TaxID=1670619 RepID=UPI00065E8D5F|nr:alpha/beta hydrolase [Nitratireductor soli]
MGGIKPIDGGKLPNVDRLWIDANGARLCCDHRRGGDRTVVLLHEMGGSLESYDAVVAGLGARWSVLRYDQRGAGRSQAPSGSLSIDMAAADLDGLLDALSIERPVALVGTAVGAGVAIGFAARHPEKVAALVLLAPATGLIAEHRAATIEKIEALEEDLRHGIADNAKSGRLATWRMLADMDLDADIAALDCPVLVAAGTDDAFRPPDHVADVAGRIAGARYTLLNTGHVMAIDTPDLVVATVTGFLDEVGFR